MPIREHALRFECQGEYLYGVLSQPVEDSERGVLIIVGGSQYRIGSHRQFTLLSRSLAGNGFPVVRFDYRGMGDSQGEPRGFEHTKDDIQAAINHFFYSVPALREVVLFGLCDAACAAVFYANNDSRVSALILANPWVRTNEGLARAYLKNYYLQRLLTRDLWRKICSGNFEFRAAAHSFASMLRVTTQHRINSYYKRSSLPVSSDNNQFSLPERMYAAMEHFPGRVLIILSGNDITAKEFLALTKSSQAWVKLMQSARMKQLQIPDANHTFSRRIWRDQVANCVENWLKS